MADGMDEEALEEIEARARKVLSKEWHYSGPYPSGSLLVLDECGEVVVSVPREPLETEESRCAAEAIAAFVAHAREDVPALTAEVRRLSRLLECARAVTAHYLEQVQERQRLPVLRACNECGWCGGASGARRGGTGTEQWCCHPEAPLTNGMRWRVPDGEPPSWCPFRSVRCST